MLAAAAVEVWGPAVPGAVTSRVATFATIAEARAFAERRFRDRPDLRMQDVTLQVAGRIVERAGPCR